MRSIEHTILLYGHLCQLSTCDRPKVFFEADDIRSECRLLIEMSSRRVEKIVLCPVENLMEISAKRAPLQNRKQSQPKESYHKSGICFHPHGFIQDRCANVLQCGCKGLSSSSSPLLLHL